MRASVHSLLLAILLCGCATEEPGVDAGTADAGTSLDAADAGTSFDADAGPQDTGPEDAGTCAYGDLTPTPMPLGPDVVTEIGDPATIDTYSAVFEDDCAITVVFETANESFTTGRLASRQTTDLLTYSPAADLDVGPEAIHANPNRVEIAGETFLYFARTAALNAPASVSRVPFVDGNFAAVEALPVLGGTTSLLSWPRFLSLQDDRVAVAYRNNVGRPFFKRSDDGLTFGAGTQISDDSIAIPTVGQFSTGELVFTYQVPGRTFVAYFSISDDGVDWTTPEPLTGGSTNVHDAILVPRADGALDAYYIYPTGPHGFSVHRRALLVDGTLGPEQVVTVAAHGNTQKPKLQRLSDGSLLLTYARVTSGSGAPTALALTVARINGDAPPP